MEFNSGLDRLPPQNLEAEQAVLGSMLLDNGVLRVVTEILSGEDFYRVSHRKIFAAMLELKSAEKEIDLITLTDELTKMGALEEVGGVSYLSRLLNETPTAANAKYHAKIVKEKASLRGLLITANQIGEQVYEGSKDPLLVIHDVRAALDELEERSGIEKLERMNISSEELLEFAAYSHETPLGVLNKAIGGFSAKNLILVGGRSGMGKTAFQLTCLRKVALDEGLPVAYIGLSNHTRELIFLKLIAAISNMDYNLLRRGNIPPDKKEEVVKAHERIANAPIYLKCASPLDVLSVLSMIRKEERKIGRFGLLIIENLQDLIWPEKTTTDKERMDKVTRALREFANSIKTPMLISSHMTRESEKGENKRPTLADFKGSGCVEDYADIALLLHRDGYHDKTAGVSSESGEEGEIIIAKGGPATIVPARFFGGRCYWADK